MTSRALNPAEKSALFVALIFPYIPILILVFTFILTFPNFKVVVLETSTSDALAEYSAPISPGIVIPEPEIDATIVEKLGLMSTPDLISLICSS